MIVSLKEAKQYLRIDGDYDDELIKSLILAAEVYLKNATSIEYDSANSLARLFCLVMITDWYENRTQVGAVSDKMRFTVQSLLAQRCSLRLHGSCDSCSVKPFSYKGYRPQKCESLSSLPKTYAHFPPKNAKSLYGCQVRITLQKGVFILSGIPSALSTCQ